MKRKQFRTRPWLVAAFALLLCTMAGFAVGKYIQTVSVSGKVTFSAKLAESMILQEHEAVRQPDGSYVLSKTATVSENETQEYVLIPGLDVPKDPHIVITGKTEIPAYLYVEVVDNIQNAAITYTMEDHWQATNEITPQHGGTVYIYCTANAGSTKTPVKITADQTISILNENKIYVSQTLLSSTTNDWITFYAYLVEATD